MRILKRINRWRPWDALMVGGSVSGAVFTIYDNWIQGVLFAGLSILFTVLAETNANFEEKMKRRRQRGPFDQDS